MTENITGIYFQKHFRFTSAQPEENVMFQGKEVAGSLSVVVIVSLYFTFANNIKLLLKLD